MENFQEIPKVEVAPRKLLAQEYMDKPTEYITKSLLDRQFELQVKKDLVESYQRLKNLKSEHRKFIRTMELSFPSDFLKMKLSDVTKDLGNPKTTKELIERLDEVHKEYSKFRVSLSSCEENGGKSNSSSQYSAFIQRQHMAKKGFATPEVHTPQFQKVFTFGSTIPSRGFPLQPPSTAKKARPAKPGEAVYSFSATGSPVIIESAPSIRMANIPPSDSARVKIDDGNGNVIDVDLVFKNASVAQRNKIVTDFRCMTRTCSAAAKKLQAHRVPVKKGGSASARKLPRV